MLNMATQPLNEILNSLIDEIPKSAQMAYLRAVRLSGDHPPSMKQIRYASKHETANVHTVAAIFGFGKCVNTGRWIGFDTVLDPDDLTSPEPLIDLTDRATMCAAAAWSAENPGWFRVPYLKKCLPSERFGAPLSGGNATDPRPHGKP